MSMCGQLLMQSNDVLLDNVILHSKKIDQWPVMPKSYFRCNRSLAHDPCDLRPIWILRNMDIAQYEHCVKY